MIMKIKLDKTTISTILWLLGELISLFRNISKENKGNGLDHAFGKAADNISKVKASLHSIEKNYDTI